MSQSTNALINELSERLAQCNTNIAILKKLTPEQLNYKPSPDSWSVLECIEHLNLYADFYLPAMEASMQKNKQSKPSGTYKSGWLGNYFANMMLPKNGKINKMKTFADKNPNQSKLDISSIERMEGDQQKLLTLLKNSLMLDINLCKVPTTISAYFPIRLADCFRFVIYHIERHIAQAMRLHSVN